MSDEPEAKALVGDLRRLLNWQLRCTILYVLFAVFSLMLPFLCTPYQQLSLHIPTWDGAEVEGIRIWSPGAPEPIAEFQFVENEQRTNAIEAHFRRLDLPPDEAAAFEFMRAVPCTHVEDKTDTVEVHLSLGWGDLPNPACYAITAFNVEGDSDPAESLWPFGASECL